MIGGLKPQVEVYALMTAGDDWAVSLSEECVLSPPQTLKKADEWLFGEEICYCSLGEPFREESIIKWSI